MITHGPAGLTSSIDPPIRRDHPGTSRSTTRACTITNTRIRGNESRGNRVGSPSLIGPVVNRRDEFSMAGAQRTGAGSPAGVSVTLKPRLGPSRAGFSGPRQQPCVAMDSRGLESPGTIVGTFCFGLFASGMREMTAHEIWIIISQIKSKLSI